MYYYPFGMEMEGPWELAISEPTNAYLYNGKERDSDFGLDWDHYGFRIYDSAIARFTGADPIADYFPHVSVYNYAENEPIANIDLHGLQKVRYDEVTETGDDGKTYTATVVIDMPVGTDAGYEPSDGDIRYAPMFAAPIAGMIVVERTAAAMMVNDGLVITDAVSDLVNPTKGFLKGLFKKGGLKNAFGNLVQFAKKKKKKRKGKEHTSGARPSTENKHEKGAARKKKEQAAADEKYAKTKKKKKKKKSKNARRNSDPDYKRKGPKKKGD